MSEEPKEKKRIRNRKKRQPGDPKPRIGRPPSIKKEIHETICRVIKIGLPLRQVADYVGVPESTIRGWCEKGEAKPDGPFGPFARDIKKAEAERTLTILEFLRRAAYGNSIVVTDPGEVDEKGTPKKIKEYTALNWFPMAWIAERTVPELRRPPSQGSPDDQPRAAPVTINLIAGQLAARFQTQEDVNRLIEEKNPSLAAARKRLVLSSPDDEENVIDVDPEPPPGKNR